MELSPLVTFPLDLNHECICACKIHDLMLYNHKDGDETKTCETVFGYPAHRLEEEEATHKEKYVKPIVEVVVKQNENTN